jgi:hypothetical protein
MNRPLPRPLAAIAAITLVAAVLLAVSGCSRPPSPTPAKTPATAPKHIVEALTPPPMGDLSVAEARQAWPDKVLWLNFTSCVHLESDESIASHARQLLAQAGSKRGFLIGVTEDCPFETLERSLRVIAAVLAE